MVEIFAIPLLFRCFRIFTEEPKRIAIQNAGPLPKTKTVVSTIPATKATITDKQKKEIELKKLQQNLENAK